MTALCVVVRKDLSPGLQRAQTIHAAHEAGLRAPFTEGTYAVALWAEDEADLRLVSYQLEKRKIPHVRIVESDAPWTGQLMAIGIVPCDRRLFKPVTQRLRKCD